MSVRWTATGTYDGSFPGAKAPAGTVVTFTGTDTLRIRDGRFVEYCSTRTACTCSGSSRSPRAPGPDNRADDEQPAGR
ncbi:hypothetical protein AB0D47_38980 [Streptomyces sp. NPDC048376]|uniref:hypothetical protein n=1 Tax=unclassified Streptomyces TaxID=2593676 RepID=UPI00343FC517